MYVILLGRYQTLTEAVYHCALEPDTLIFLPPSVLDAPYSLAKIP